jgi:hypothetical protein
MLSRRGEKQGWTFGWSGGFLWVWILSLLALARGELLQAATGVLIAVAATAVIVWCAPWRHPETPYSLLMAPVYFLLAGALAWGAWSAGGLRALGFASWGSLFLLLPLSLPFWIVGRRRWSDGIARQADAADGADWLSEEDH